MDTRVFCLLLLLLAAGPVRAAEDLRPNTAAELDVRLVVDVSGSMAKADPDGMLAPALQLFLELLPDASQAGVWTFAQQVNALVPHAPVTPMWRTQAQIKTQSLPTVGLRTALGAAIDQAAWDWQQPSSRVRHLILLTDGEVDLADSSAVNQAARRILLRERLPVLAAAGFRIHTLALSERGDVAFLQEAARLSSGHFLAPDSPETLPEELVQLFAAVGPADRIPLAVAGRSVNPAAEATSPTRSFQVEPGLDELTLFMSKQPEQVLALEAPDGSRFDRSRIPPASRWHVSERYELLTLSDPAVGRWHLTAGEAEVFSYGSLQLRLLDRPRRIAPGSALSLGFVLESGDLTVPLAPEFLDLVRFSATVEAAEGRPKATVIADPQGPMQVLLDGLRGVEQATLVLTASGPTFARELRVEFELAHPLRIELQPGRTAQTPASLWVTLNQPGLEPGSARVAAGLRSSPGPQRWYPLAAQPAGMWRAQIPPELSGRVEIEVDVHAKYLNGGEFNYRTNALVATLPLAEAHRFSFAGSGRVDTPARLLDNDPADSESARALAEPASIGTTNSAETEGAQPPPNAAAALAAQRTESAASDEAGIARSEPAQVPVWFAGIGMLLPLLLVGGLGWMLLRSPINRVEPSMEAVPAPS